MPYSTFFQGHNFFFHCIKNVWSLYVVCSVLALHITGTTFAIPLSIVLTMAFHLLSLFVFRFPWNFLCKYFSLYLSHSKHFWGRFLRDTNEGHEPQPSNCPRNLTYKCKYYFRTHSMHFRDRFPRDTKPIPPTALEFDVPLSITFLNTFHAFSGEVFRGTRNPIPPTTLEFDVPLSITFLNTFQAFLG